MNSTYEAMKKCEIYNRLRVEKTPDTHIFMGNAINSSYGMDAYVLSNF